MLSGVGDNASMCASVEDFGVCELFENSSVLVLIKHFVALFK